MGMRVAAGVGKEEAEVSHGEGVAAAGGEGCLVKYDGPESIGSGVKAAIKEKFPDITNVVFTQ